MNNTIKWFSDRIGWTASGRPAPAPSLPGGASWWNVWPSTILFAFTVQAITGFVLWMYYSPSAHSAWESVYYIQHELTAGWLVRGIHHYAAQVMVALAGIYIIQMILRGTYRAPRELVFWSALVVAALTMAMVLTGDLLPWTQNSYWATQVRVNFLTLLPMGGEFFKLAAGGPQFGHFTLTRFFALHAGLFTLLLAAAIWLHGFLRRRAARLEAATAERMGWYWPDQAVRNMAACAVVAVVIGLLTVQHAFVGEHSGATPGAYLGAELGAPADPVDAYSAARPEWSLLGVYGFSHMFPGSLQILPIFVIPSIVFGLFVLMPFIGLHRAGHVFNVVLLVALLAGIVYLSVDVVRHDRQDQGFQASLAAGNTDAHRVIELARGPNGIPATGALGLLREDAKTQGPKLFKQHCASCHNYSHPDTPILAEKSSAPELYQFASRQWIEGFFDPKRIDGPEYFGNTAFSGGDMVSFVQDNFRQLRKEIGEEDTAKLFEMLAAESKLTQARKVNEEEETVEGIDEDTYVLFEDFTCTDCHKFYTLGSSSAGPDLTGYGSREWVIGIIADPTHKRFYGGNNDRMPAYGQPPDQPMLTTGQIEMIADWMRGEWFRSE